MKLMHLRIPSFEDEAKQVKSDMFVLATAPIVLKGTIELKEMFMNNEETYTLIPDWAVEQLKKKAEQLGVTDLLDDFMVFKQIK